MDGRRLQRAMAISLGVAFLLGGGVAGGSQATAAARGPAVQNATAWAAPECQNRADCGSPLKAGLRITFTGWACTIGFFASNPETRKLFVVTAGHCTSGSGLFAQWSHHGTVIGRAALDAFEDGSTADAGAIELEESAFANVVYASAGSDLRRVEATLPDTSQTIGSEVCRSGVTSGWTCGKIVAVDIADDKLAFARSLGATHTLNARSEDAVQRVREITGGGADHTFECVGNPATLTQLVEMIRPGGHGYVVGAAPPGTRFPFPTDGFIRNKHLHGVMQGNVRATVDIPRYVDLYAAGKLPLDRLVTRTYPLDAINDAIAALEQSVGRGVVVFG